MPRGTNAPKLCPAEPRRLTVMVLSGRPSPPHRRSVRCSCSDSASGKLIFSTAGTPSEVRTGSTVDRGPLVGSPSRRRSHRCNWLCVTLARSVTLGSFHPRQPPAKLTFCDAIAADSLKAQTGAPADGKHIGMGAGAYVGRIGALAAALGIGAAVFIGEGVASAEPSSASGSESSSTNSSISTSGTSLSESKQPAEEKTTTDSSETKSAVTDPAPKKKKKSSATQPSTRTTRDAVGSTGKTGIATARTVQSDATESTKVAEDPAPTASVSVARTASVVSADVQQPARPTVTAREAPVAVVTTAISSLVSAVLNPFAGNGSTGAPESPSTWMLMAAARHESFGRTPTLTKAVNPVTTSGDAGPVASTVTALAVAAAPPAVVARPQTPPLALLQLVPVIGPNFVTPIVGFIEQIPLIGDVLHPLIGYPVQPGLPADTPVPRK